MRSFSEMDGDMFRYLKREKVAEMGTECCIPFFQSLIRLFLKNSFCGEVSEFCNRPVYESFIFSYQRSPPTDFFRLKGAVCDMVTVTLGKLTESVES